jgi:crotonobetainyl-CoA:carnitine CoA-transferase CaiB-like acyl-CoA transferase
VLRPDIIYCAISGYGQTGPRRDYPAIDNIVQATSGMMDLLAGPDSGGELVPFPVVDTYTATQAALAILAALLQRNRDGGSQFIDVAMLDSSLTLMSSVIVPFLIGGILRTRHSGAKRGYSNSPLSGIFTTADGRLISLGVVQDNQFALFCELVDRPDLLADPRFANTVTRLTHGEALTAEVAGLFLTRSAEHWESLLSGRGVPCGVVRDIGSAASQPGLADRGVLNELVVRGLPDREQVSVIGLGFRFAHDGPHPAAPPPWLGEHSSEVLRTLGYDEPACAQLIASGVVRQHTACHQKR